MELNELLNQSGKAVHPRSKKIIEETLGPESLIQHPLVAPPEPDVEIVPRVRAERPSAVEHPALAEDPVTERLLPQKGKALLDTLMEVSSFIPNRGYLPGGHISLRDFAEACHVSVATVRHWIERLTLSGMWGYQPHFIKARRSAGGGGAGYRYFRPEEIALLLENTPMGLAFDVAIVKNNGPDAALAASMKMPEPPTFVPQSEGVGTNSLDIRGAIERSKEADSLQRLAKGDDTAIRKRLAEPAPPQLTANELISEALERSRMIAAFGHEGLLIEEDLLALGLKVTKRWMRQQFHLEKGFVAHGYFWEPAEQLGKTQYWRGDALPDDLR